MAITQQGFPNVSSPMVDTRGYIQQSWLQLLINLWARTGSSQGSSIFNAGDIKESAASGEPLGWLECNGRAVSRSTYSILFGTIGTTYGPGDGSTTFNLPDYRGRFRIGTNVSYPLGTIGGSSSTVLSVGNLPAHTHGVTDPGHTHTFTGTPHIHGTSDPGHAHPSVVPSSTNTAGTAAGATIAGNTGSALTAILVVAAIAGGTNAPNTTGIVIDPTGAGTPFTNLPPYTPVTVLIKT